MILHGKVVETRAASEKFGQLAKSLKQFPFLVIKCQAAKGESPEAIMISPQLFKMLGDYYEAYGVLASSPDFGDLRAENNLLRQQVRSLMTELKSRMGENERVSDECWREIRESIYESLKRKTELWE